MNAKFLLIYLIGGVSIVTAVVSEDCRKTSVIRNGKEYRLFTEKLTLREASERCSSWGKDWKSPSKSDLVSDIDAGLQTCLTEMIKTGISYANDHRENVSGVFLGGVKLRKWVWKNKEKRILLKNETGFQKWAENQPMHIDPSPLPKRCLSASMSRHEGTELGDWEDNDCEAQMYYVCQREINQDLLWGYSDNNHAVPPEKWGNIEEFKECGNQRVPQSPQDMQVSTIVPNCDYGDIQNVLRWEAKEGVNIQWKVKNTGRMIEIRVLPEGSLFTRFGNRGIKHVVDYMHLKWGSDGSSGSEHTIGGIRYAGELQIFHTNNSNGERHAIAFMIQERPFISNRRWNTLLQSILRASEAKSSSIMTSPRGHIMNLLEDGGFARSSYITGRAVRYRGSIPHPPCTQNIIWTVYVNPIQIAKLQFDALRRINMEGRENNFSRRMTQTTRPIQPSMGPQCVVSRF